MVASMSGWMNNMATEQCGDMHNQMHSSQQQPSVPRNWSQHMMRIWVLVLAAWMALPVLVTPLGCTPADGSIPPGITYEEHLSHHQ